MELSKTFNIFITIFSILHSHSSSAAERRLGSRIASLFPIANGPFYGFPYGGETTSSKLAPFTVSGTCKEGTVYNITKVHDLFELHSEIECVYSAGLTPDKIPEGPLHGKLLGFLNTPIFNPIANAWWQGKFIQKVECNGKTQFLGWNNFLRTFPWVPFVARIKHLELNLAPGEYDDGKDSLIIDYTQDLKQICPDYTSSLQRNYENVIVRRRTLNDPFPLNTIVDVLRFVGKQEDGGSIYLGKVYSKDAFRSDMQAATVGMFTLVNSDTSLNEKFQFGDALPPLKTTFKYMHPGMMDLPFRLLPIDNLITTPVRTVQKIVQEALKMGRNTFSYTGELSRGFGSFWRNSQRFHNAFFADKKVK